ncbi:hypothetical protein SSBR45G_24820 [Bradyrhizobium sp. SSBR45G]|nr:hypothetical protein SSBR45G_24820 [Bradyrhizobium sp. SSBR45G]GLH84811.1 hypothetical protein SSBR45R_22710 [Bradyrhizobium sp. SSBR45R]
MSVANSDTVLASPADVLTEAAAGGAGGITGLSWVAPVGDDGARAMMDLQENAKAGLKGR